MSTGPSRPPISSVSPKVKPAGPAPVGAYRADEAPPGQTALPRWLVTGGAWSWRLVGMGIVGYFLLKFVLRIQIVVLPFMAAMVFTALLRPLTVRLQAHRVNRLAATWLTFMVAVLAVLGVGTLVVYRSVHEWHTLISDLTTTSDKLRHWLSHGPLHLKDSDLSNLQQKAIAQLNNHRGAIVNGIVSGASIAGEFLAGIVLAAFMTFFLLYDGARIWHFVTSPLRPRTAERVDRAAEAAWTTLSGYIRGTVVISGIHAVVMCISLIVLGVPLVAPLTLLVFVTSFVPLIGVLVGGGLAVFVTLGTQGIVPGLILLGILVVEHQSEGHLLQPLVMGRYVALHPLAIAISLAIGTILQGIVGAIVAVPLVAMVHSAWPHLRESQLLVGPDDPPPPGSVLVGGRQL